MFTSLRRKVNVMKIYRVFQTCAIAGPALAAPCLLGYYRGNTMAFALSVASQKRELPIGVLRAEVDLLRSFPAIGACGYTVHAHEAPGATYYGIARGGAAVRICEDMAALERFNGQCEVERKARKLARR